MPYAKKLDRAYRIAQKYDGRMSRLALIEALTQEVQLNTYAAACRIIKIAQKLTRPNRAKLKRALESGNAAIKMVDCIPKHLRLPTTVKLILEESIEMEAAGRPTRSGVQHTPLPSL